MDKKEIKCRYYEAIRNLIRKEITMFTYQLNFY